jgi:hypothetical protein
VDREDDQAERDAHLQRISDEAPAENRDLLGTDASRGGVARSIKPRFFRRGSYARLPRHDGGR